MSELQAENDLFLFQFKPKTMNQRVQDILAYLDDQQTSSPSSSSSNDETPITTNETPMATTTKIPAPSAPTSDVNQIDLSIFNDDKMYNKLARQMKKNKYPMIFEGKVLNNEGEAQAFKASILASRRDYKRGLRQKKIQESQMNFEAMPTINDDEFEDLYEEDGYVYKKSKYPYAVHKDGKKKLIPKTSVKDTKKIYQSIEQTSGKEGIKHLVKAETDEEFRNRSDEAINKVDDTDVRNSYYNHTHNDFADDKTWNQASFLKLMYAMMKENEELKSKAAPTPVKQASTSAFRINPALLKK